jgi:hypothetical protein
LEFAMDTREREQAPRSDGASDCQGTQASRVLK